MNDYVSFQSFHSEEEASSLAEIFSKNNIDCTIVKAKPIIDSVIIGEDAEDKIYLKIKNSDFKKANEVLQKQIEENLDKIGDDYYLYSFSNNELLEIINKSDEWSKQDFFVAKKILTERGLSISEKDISKIRWERIKEIGKQEKGSTFWIIIGYIFSIGGIFGFFFGLGYLTAKKILPDGNRVFVYDEATRNHGRTMLIISSIFILIDILTGLGLRGMIF